MHPDITQIFNPKVYQAHKPPIPSCATWASAAVMLNLTQLTRIITQQFIKCLHIQCQKVLSASDICVLTNARINTLPKERYGNITDDHLLKSTIATKQRTCNNAILKYTTAIHNKEIRGILHFPGFSLNIITTISIL